jgi:hypothetical protein
MSIGTLSPAMPRWRTPKWSQLRYCVKVALAAVVAYALTVGDTLLIGLLSELQQIRAALLAMRDSDSRASNALNQD